MLEFVFFDSRSIPRVPGPILGGPGPSKGPKIWPKILMIIWGPGAAASAEGLLNQSKSPKYKEAHGGRHQLPPLQALPRNPSEEVCHEEPGSVPERIELQKSANLQNAVGGI